MAEKIRAGPNLNLLVNNAGFGSLWYFHETDVRVQDQMHRVHVLAIMRLTQAALANLVPRGAGGVINVSSVAAFGQAPQSVSYCATKAWINSFTEGLAIELGAQDSPVKVQALCPGFTLSEFHETLGMDRGPIPRSLWMTADFVVDASLRGLDRGDLFVIPGWRYKLLVGVLKLLSGALMRRASIAASAASATGGFKDRCLVLWKDGPRLEVARVLGRLHRWHHRDGNPLASDSYRVSGF